MIPPAEADQPAGTDRTWLGAATRHADTMDRGAERIAWREQPGHLPDRLWRGCPRSREVTPLLVQRWHGRLDHPRDTWHDGWELVVVLRGRGVLLTDDHRPLSEAQREIIGGRRSWPLTPGTAWLIPPRLAHRGHSDADIDLVWIAFAGSCCDALPPQLTWCDNAEELAAPARQLWLRAEQRASAVGAELDGLARIVLGRALATTGRSGPARPIDLLIERINALRAGALRLDRIATQAGCSTRHLNRLCRQRTGLSPLRYLRRVRIERARLLIAQGGRTLGEIAALCGFADPSHFSRAFRAETGRAPSDS